jgi:preprotein translocase subunit SecY
LKVNSGGVMPVIFAASILSAPMLLENISLFGSGPLRDTSFLGPIFRALAPAEPWYVVLYVFSIIFFAYLTRITLVGAVYLVAISIIPMFLISGIHFNHLWLVGGIFDRMPTWVTNGLGLNFYFGGTSLLIVVGVAMDTVQQVEAQLIMRHYDGFSPKSGRIRGRRSW